MNAENPMISRYQGLRLKAEAAILAVMDNKKASLALRVKCAQIILNLAGAPQDVSLASDPDEMTLDSINAEIKRLDIV